jgi:hypothetical protein
MNSPYKVFVNSPLPKREVEDIDLRVVHIVLIRGYNWEKVNITLKIVSDIHFGTIIFCKLFTHCGT